jgi:hypothetical protein
MYEDVLCASLRLFAGAGNTFAVCARRDADYRLCVFSQVKPGGYFGKKIFSFFVFVLCWAK